MSKKRAGVEAAVRLSRSKDAQLWSAVEKQFPCLIEVKDDEGKLQKERKMSMVKLESFYNDLSEKLSSGQVKHLTRDSLTSIVNWKFSVGKKRPYNVLGNSEEAIQKHSQKAIELAKEVKLSDLINKNGEVADDYNKRLEVPMKEIMELKGVGPATASAVLSMVNPHAFCYMYDETIDCFENQRKYDLKSYVRVNQEFHLLAIALGRGWTTKRVARVLWIAARSCADPNCEDLTAKTTSPPPPSTAKGKKQPKKREADKSTTTTTKIPPSKRRKR